MKDKKAERIQTSILNAAEKKALVWLAERQPKWMTSDLLTAIGSVGALLIGLGFYLSSNNLNFLWLAIFGFFVNWYGDSLDGTLARVRKIERPVYGYYLDHTVDCINEMMMFLGIGLSSLMHLNIALFIMIAYFLITINVSVNAHLKSEFRLTYAKLGPTEFRIIAVILCLLLMYIPGATTWSTQANVLGQAVTLKTMDIAGIVIFVILMLMYFVSIISDARGYAKSDPKDKSKLQK